MKRYLASTIIATALMAAPGFAMAQNNNVSGGNNGNTAGWNHNVGNSNTGVNPANNASNGVAYGNLGQGGYTAMAMPIQNNNNNNTSNNNAANQRPSQRNPLLADNGDVRASKFIGTTIHNDHDQNIGSVDDILIGRNGVWAIVSTNNKKVAVPFQNFVLGDASAQGDDKLVLPNMTQAQLNTLPVVHYNETNYANNGGNNNPGLFGNGTVRNNNHNNGNNG